jgi:hypothetical protein
VILFLDFDGVLHPVSPFNKDVGVFCQLEQFESVMREFPLWKIVISSSWREEYSLELMRGFFSPDIATRIVGATPVISSEEKFTREDEIRIYLRSTGQLSTTWIALDDASENFLDKTNLVLCSREVGLDRITAAKLRNALGARS